MVRAEGAWSVSTGKGIVVAVVDTGVDLGHPDLRNRLVRGATFVGCRSKAPCGDGHWVGADGEAGRRDGHGTLVAGLVAAARNGVGIVGVAPDARIMPVKVLDTNASTEIAQVAQGIVWAVDHGADVVNLSLSVTPVGRALAVASQQGDLTAAVEYALERGVVVVASAGNDGAALPCGHPADANGVICVGSVDKDERPPLYSQRAVKRSQFAVVAPGGPDAGLGCGIGVLSTVPRGQGGAPGCEYGPNHRTGTGTSMAAPHVAGVAALLLSSGLENDETVKRILSTARDPLTGSRGQYTPLFGFGIVDADEALSAR